MLDVGDCFAYAASLTGVDRCPRTLKLAFNELKDDGAIIISRFLSRFPSLTSLDLGRIVRYSSLAVFHLLSPKLSCLPLPTVM